MGQPVSRLAIMQPYFLPYIGYFQLMAAVDRFVVFDDVNYINRGWINRNRILVNGAPALFTIPLHSASQNKLISDIQIVNDDQWRKKILKTIHQSYSKACNFKQTYELLEYIVEYPSTELNIFLLNSLRTLANYLDIETDIISSSKKYGNAHLKGQDRILDMCLQEEAQFYLNPVGGMELYHRDDFHHKRIGLAFVKSRDIAYFQGTPHHVPWLSIVDVLMFNSKDAVKDLLLQYDLLEN